MGKDCSDSAEQAPPFIRSVLSLQAAMAMHGSPPCPCVLGLGISYEQAATDPGTAYEWARALARMAKNFEENIAEAEPTSEEDHAVVRKWVAVLGALREAHRHAEAHVADFGTPRVPLALVRSLFFWEVVILGATAYPTSFGLVPGVDLERASVDPIGAAAWVEFLESVAEKIVKLQSDAALLGVECPLVNWEGMLHFLQLAAEKAKEHLAGFGNGSQSVTTASAPQGTSNTATKS